MPKSNLAHKANNFKNIFQIKNGSLPAVLTQHWRSVISETSIDSLCQPLLQYGVNYFLYVKRYVDGSQLEISSHPNWSEYYYKHEFYNIGPFKNIRRIYDSGKHFWFDRGDAFEKMYSVARESFNIDNGYTIVKKYSDCNEFFHFAGKAKNTGLINFYLNYNDVLERFILYFKDKYGDVINVAEKNKFIIQYHEEQKENTELNSHTRFQLLEIAKTMPINRYFLCEHRNTYLTSREVECVKWYITGKSAEEIAIILNISKRTVETHLEKVKKKLNCYKQSQLAGKIQTLIDIL